MSRALTVFLCCFVALAASLGWGNSNPSVTVPNGTVVTASSLSVSGFPTAEDRRLFIALNWARQDPATWKSFMDGKGLYTFPSAAFLTSRSPTVAPHWDDLISASSHWHALREANTSPLDSIAYDSTTMCPNPDKWNAATPTANPCSPPLPFLVGGVNKTVECFRVEDCYDPAIDIGARLAYFGRSCYPETKTIGCGSLYIGGTAYSSDVAQRQVDATMNLLCDSNDPINAPYNCTISSTGNQAVLYGSLASNFSVAGAAYYASANAYRINYMDESFAGTYPPATAGPIASAGLLAINNQQYFVINYRDQSDPTKGFPLNVGLLYQNAAGTGAYVALNHDTSAGTVYNIAAPADLGSCNNSTTVAYAFFAIDSTKKLWRYPEDVNLDACAGNDVGDLDTTPEAGPCPVSGGNNLCIDSSGNPIFLGVSINSPTTPQSGLQPAGSSSGLASSSSGLASSSSGLASNIAPALTFVIAALIMAMLSM